MVVLALPVGGNTLLQVKFAAGSLTSTSGMEGTREAEGEQAVKEQRRKEMVCQSGVQMMKMEKWEPLILLERLCLSRRARKILFQKRSLSSRGWRMRKRTVLIKKRRTEMVMKKARK
ncbi:hypothetical protein M9458_015487, partial [Cirrhinus mrigala]